MKKTIKKNLKNIHNELLKKYNKGEIWLFDLFDFKCRNNFYTKYIEEFWEYHKKYYYDIKTNLTFIDYLEEKIPHNNFFQDYKNFHIIDWKKLKNFSNKKKLEYIQLFCFWGRDFQKTILTFEELLNYWKPIEKESHGEWDFFNKKDNVEIEISDLTNAVDKKLQKKVQKKYDTSKKPTFNESEIFEYSKKIIFKKLNKKPKNSEFNIISFNINCYSKDDFRANLNSIFQYTPLFDDKNGKFMKISKYHEIIKIISKKRDINIKNGFVSFWYGKTLSNRFIAKRIRIYKIKNFYLDYKNYEDFEFDNKVFQKPKKIEIMDEKIVQIGIDRNKKSKI